MLFALSPFELMASGLIYLLMERVVPGWKEAAMKAGRDWTGLLVSALVVGAALYAMAAPGATAEGDIQWAIGALGAIAGYWIKE